MSRVVFTLIALFSLLACEPAPFFEQLVQLPASGWEYQAYQQFQFSIKDTSKRYELALKIQHGTEYEYQNLYLNLATIFPNNDSLNQTLSVDLADPQGRWYGDCSNRSCNVEILLQQNAFFNQTGKHQLDITQHMRVDPLLHLRALTIILTDRQP